MQQTTTPTSMNLKQLTAQKRPLIKLSQLKMHKNV